MTTSVSPKYIVAAVGDWNRELFEQSVGALPGQWFYANDPKSLLAVLRDCNPRFIFFPHWRWMVADDIVIDHECVCFHMTNLPYGRGGSPLQNLIIRGHRETVLTALRMTSEVDAGPIYKQLPLSLDGSAARIYRRCSEQVWRLITEIIRHEPEPVEQSGEPVFFTRRQPQDSRLPEGLSMQQTYDYIRMLDAPGYPRAFCEIDGYRVEFENASLQDDSLTATVRITKNGDSSD